MDEQELQSKYDGLRRLLADLHSVLVAFSGGVDSTLLLRVAADVLGRQKVIAGTARCAFVPAHELEDAGELAREIGVKHRILDAEVLGDPDIMRNSPDRCYFCKRVLLAGLKRIAREEGVEGVVEASNLDDAQGDFRPGLRAVEELAVRSPLREVRMGKAHVRELSRRLGLRTHDRPSSACLASRIPYGEPITAEKLERVEKAEDVLRGMGLRQFRVRSHGHLARIELGPKEDIGALICARAPLTRDLKRLGYLYVTLDLEGYRMGSMNEAIAAGRLEAGRCTRKR